MKQLLHHDEAYEGWTYFTNYGQKVRVVSKRNKHFPFVEVEPIVAFWKQWFSPRRTFKIAFYNLYSEDL